jgi:branched-chain amino acid transport system permease protein
MIALLNSYGFLIVSCLSAAVLALSLYLPLLAGQLSLAAPGFYAVGGYTAAIMSTQVFPVPSGAPYPLGLLLVEMTVAGGACALLAVLVGVPALRLQGIYLALATIAFVEVLRVLALNLTVAGGAIGIFGIPQVFGSPLGYVWVAGPLLLAACLFTMRLEKTRVGRSLIAVREDELAAASVGVNPPPSKLTAFVLGGVLAGLTGAMSAHFLNTWNSRQGTFDVSIAVLAFVLIGGSRTWLGPVVGGVALTALPELLRASADVGQLPAWMGDLLRDGRLIIYGLLLAVGCLFFPRGLVTPELYAFIGRRFRRLINRPTEEDEQMTEAAVQATTAASTSGRGGAQ